MFEGRRLLIATKHEKEKVMAPLLDAGLGVVSFVNVEFDTDTLGTFSGEVERKLDPLATARKKCLLAMEMSNCDLGIASEGSFGAHPTLFFGNADDELLIFIDKKNNLEIIARDLSAETNFNGSDIKNEKELFAFADLVQFPSHALILRASKNDNTSIVKGITNLKNLKKSFHAMLQKHKNVYVETDMRAMYNPSRMVVIENATKKLLAKIHYCCPQCNTPGFGVTDAKKGLPCNLCDAPTKSTLSLVYSCQKCHHKREKKYPNKKTTEDPMYCDYCNP